jgi:hypothetical protein
MKGNKNAYKVMSETGRESHVGNISKGWRINLRWILGKKNMRVWTGFISFRIEINCWLF